jgi:Mg2+/Co2+ transporter CorB
VALGQVFVWVLRVFSGSETALVPHNHLHLHVALRQKDKRSKLGNLSKSNVLSEMEEHCVEKCFIPLFWSLRN